MKEYVLVEFIFTDEEAKSEISKLTTLGEDFTFIRSHYEYEDDNDGNREEYIRVSGRINSMTASVIKLQNPTLAGKMRISYIPEDLKDKYRR